MKQKINNIQALRAFAALAVVSFHTGFVFPRMHAIGSFGVDIFFVISGYIMARICESNSRFFLRRRLIRILPPYWIMTILLFLIAWRFPQWMQATQADGVELAKSLLFVPYFKSNGLLRPLLFVGWSLNYEMFFYLAISAGLFLVPRRPLLFASGVVLAVTAACFPLARFGALPAFYGNRIMIEFVLGIMAYEIARHVPEQVAHRIRPLSLLTLITAIAGLICRQGIPHTPFTGEWMLPQLCGMLLILSASFLSQGGWDIRLAWMVLIGDASYILYLVHPYIEYFTDRILARRVPWLTISHALGSTIVLILSVLIAVFLHVKLERPGVAWLNKRFGGSRKSTEFKGVQATPGQVAP